MSRLLMQKTMHFSAWMNAILNIQKTSANQTSPFKVRWHIVFLILIIFMLRARAEYELSPEFNLTVQVVGLPTLVIILPVNYTYFNETMILKILSNGNNTWYNIDNGINISFVNETIFYTTNGNHVLNVFSENIYGTTSKNVLFTVDTTLLTIIYDEYKGLDKGNSTNFNYLSYDEIGDLDGVILENVNYGKIELKEKINLTDDSNFSDNKVDLDSNTNISQSKIEVNINALGNLNKNSRLSFYNLNFNNPRIMLNGAECPLSTCTLISYIGGNLILNATNLGSFIIDEMPSGSTGGGNTGGGGRGGGGAGGGTANNVINKLLNKGNFIVNKDKLVVKLKKGEAKREKLDLENTGEEDLELNLSNKDLENFLRASERKFILKKGEKTSILLDFLALEETKTGVYVGKLIISNGNVKKEILIKIV